MSKIVSLLEREQIHILEEEICHIESMLRECVKELHHYNSRPNKAKGKLEEAKKRANFLQEVRPIDQ